ncbi:MAG TPA: glucose-1-phosphate cytidylyltransferase [Vicinamibacterales bacterium]|nr:glucose-1-phosphate cytidylyltransferase [Vicinamibacterales bacterium]
MKVVILAGGLGTRLAEETEIKPKPMVEVGGQPILWHIMKHYAQYGLKEFYIALGYRGDIIKRFFLDCLDLDGSISIGLASGCVERKDRECEDWIVHLKNTGQHTQTGGRLKRLESCLDDGTFMLTYGDGVSDVNLDELLRFHRAHGRMATVTAVRPPSRFGGLVLDGDMVADFTEKPRLGEGWINGGFLVLEPEVCSYLKGDDSSLEIHALERLASDKQLAAYRHEGFWQSMDTLRDKRLLEGLWQDGRAPWKSWK